MSWDEPDLTPIANTPSDVIRSPPSLSSIDLDEMVRSLTLGPQKKKESKRTQPSFVYSTATNIIPAVVYTRIDNEIDPILWVDQNPPQPDASWAGGQAFYVYFGCIGDGNCLFHAFLKGGTHTYQQSYSVGTITEATLQEMENPLIVGPGRQAEVYFQDRLFDKPRNKNNPGVVYKIQHQAQFDQVASLWRIKYTRLIRDDLARNYISSDNYIQGYLYEKDPDYLVSVLSAIPENAKFFSSLNPARPVDSIEILKNFIATELYGADYVEIEHLPILGEFLGIDVYVVSEALITDPKGYNFPLAGGMQMHRYVRGPKFLRDPNDRFYHEEDRYAIVINFVNNLHYELVGKQVQTGGTGIASSNSQIITFFDSEEPLIVYLYLKLKDKRFESE